MHVSNFRPVKRVQDCVRILAEVLRHTPAHLVMVGDGPERGPAEHLARELGLERHVSFLGKQNHVERIIPLAHVLLMPSDLESFGLVALEAMACGVPPVATRVGGVPELITDDVDGYLEAVGDIAAQAAWFDCSPTPNCTAACRERPAAPPPNASARTASSRSTNSITKKCVAADRLGLLGLVVTVCR